MNIYVIKLGFWSAFCAALTFVLFTICFIGVAITSPIFIWTNLNDYLDYATTNNLFLQNLARFCMLMFALLFVILCNVIHDIGHEEKKVFARIANSFAIGFAVLVGLFYFVQLTAVRLSVQQGDVSGLEQVVQANPLSALSAMNMLGWTLFFGLASLFLMPLFTNGRLENTIRLAFLCNGLFCLIGGVSYLLQWLPILFVSINLGMGISVMVAMCALAVDFKRKLMLFTH